MNEYLTGLSSQYPGPVWNKMGWRGAWNPNPKTKPYIREYSEALSRLKRTAESVLEEQAEQRVSMLPSPLTFYVYVHDPC